MKTISWKRPVACLTALILSLSQLVPPAYALRPAASAQSPTVQRDLAQEFPEALATHLGAENLTWQADDLIGQPLAEGRAFALAGPEARKAEEAAASYLKAYQRRFPTSAPPAESASLTSRMRRAQEALTQAFDQITIVIDGQTVPVSSRLQAVVIITEADDPALIGKVGDVRHRALIEYGAVRRSIPISLLQLEAFLEQGGVGHQALIDYLRIFSESIIAGSYMEQNEATVARVNEALASAQERHGQTDWLAHRKQSIEVRTQHAVEYAKTVAVSVEQTGTKETTQPSSIGQRFVNAFRPGVRPTRETPAGPGFRSQEYVEEDPLISRAAMAVGIPPRGQDPQVVDVLQRIGLPATTPWASVQGEWRIERLHHVLPNISASGWTDSHTGEPITKDFFGNYPAWVYELRHEQTRTTIYVGPDDIETLFHGFPDRLNEKETIRKEKEASLTRIRERLQQLQRLQALLGIRPEEVTWHWPSSRQRYLGEQDAVDIDAATQQLERVWRSRVPGLSLDEGIEVLTKLEEVLRTFGPRRGRTTILTDQEMDRLHALLAQLQTDTAFTAADRDWLLQLHQLLLLRQTELVRETREWGGRRPVAYDPEHERKTPAYHANLEIAAWLVEQQQAHPSWRPFILDAGANISVLYRILRELMQASGLETNLASDIVDLEADPTIYAAAINPQRVLADVTQLPATQAATDESVQELAQTPHQFGVVVASFILDQLTPEQMPLALVAFEHLLAEPPDPTQHALQQETITDFPLLIIASPEHSPLHDSPLDQVLQGPGGYTLIRQATLTHQLTSAARQRLLKEEGREVLALMEQMTSKPFHLAIYAKTAPADLTAIRAIKPDEWKLRRGRGGRGRGGGGTTRPTTVNVQHLLVLDLLPSLSPNDFQTHTSAIVARQTMLNDPAYADFEERLAALIYNRDHLRPTDAQVLDAILTLWDRQRVAFLSDEQVRFIMGKPDESRTLGYQQLLERYGHLRPQMQQRYRAAVRAESDRLNDVILRERGRWDTTADRMLESRLRTFEMTLQRNFLSFWELYQEEERFRREHPERGLPNLATQLRSRYSMRIRGIREAADTLRKNGQKIHAAAIAKLLGLSRQALLEWAKHNNENVLSLVNAPNFNEERLQAIRGIVAASPTTATRSFVAGQLGITPKHLSDWARGEGYKLSDLGIIPESQIRAQSRVVEAEEKQAQPRAFSKLPEVVAYVERLFEEDQDRMALPSHQTIGEAVGVHYTTIAHWMPDILQALQDSKNPRVVQALRYQETTTPSQKTRAEEIADHIQGLFEADPSRTTFPPPGDIARALNISPNRVSENMRGALQHLRNIQDQRLLQAVEAWESTSRSGRRSSFDPTRIVEYIKQLFQAEPNRTTLPPQRQFGEALGISHGTITSRMTDILQALRATGDVRIINAVELWEQHSKVRQLPPPQIGKQMQVLGVMEHDDQQVLRVVSPMTPDQIVELPLTPVDVELPAIVEILRGALAPEEAGSAQALMDTLAAFLRSPPTPLPRAMSFETLLADLHGYASVQPAVIALYERLLSLQDQQLRALAIFHELGEYLVQTRQLSLALEYPTQGQPVLSVIVDGRPSLIPLTRSDALAIALKDRTGPHYLLRALQRQLFGALDERLTQMIKQHQQELADQITQVEDRRRRPQVRGNGWLRVSATDAQAKRFHQTFVSTVTGTYTALIGTMHVTIPAPVWAKMARWFGESPALERLGSFVMTQQPDGSWHAIDFVPMASYATDPESIADGPHPADVMQVTVPVGHGRAGFPAEVERAMGFADPAGGIPVASNFGGGPVSIVLAHSHHQGSALGDWPTREDRYTVRDVLAGFVYNMTNRQGRFFTRNQLSEPSQRQRINPSEETAQATPPSREIIQAYRVQIGRRLARLREVRGLGVTELAQHVGITRSTLGRLERGQLDSSIAIWFRLAVGLGVPVELLLDNEAEGVVLEPSVDETRPITAERVEDFLKTIGDRLRRTRLSQRDSQDDVAARGGVGRRSVSSAESANELPVGTWFRLATGVGLPMRTLITETSLQTIYNQLYRAFGPQHWWPAESAFEVMVEAILVQATSWQSAEQTIARLKEANALTPQRLAEMPLADLEQLLRSSNFFRQKAARLQLFSRWFLDRYEGDVAAMFSTPTQQLREELLTLRGIGQETADSILLYAGQHPVFVVGTYTQRVLRRHGLIGERANYSNVQQLAREELPLDARVYNEAHALLVKVGQEFCHGCDPDCPTCPLGNLPHTIEEGAIQQPTSSTRLTHGVGAAADGEPLNRRESLMAQLRQFLPELLTSLPPEERAHILRVIRRWSAENERLWNQVVPEVLRDFDASEAEALGEMLQIQAAVAHNLKVLDSEAFLASGIPLAVGPGDRAPETPRWRILIAVDDEGRIVAYGPTPESLQSVESFEPEEGIEEIVYLSQGHDQRFYASQWSPGRPVPEGVAETVEAYNAQRTALEAYNRQVAETLGTELSSTQPPTFPLDEGPGDDEVLQQIVENNVNYLAEMDLYSDWSTAAHRQLPPEALDHFEEPRQGTQADLDQIDPTQWKMQVTVDHEGLIIGADDLLEDMPDDSIVVVITQGDRAELVVSALLKGARIPLAFMRSLEAYNALGEQAATQPLPQPSEPPSLPEIDAETRQQIITANLAILRSDEVELQARQVSEGEAGQPETALWEVPVAVDRTGRIVALGAQASQRLQEQPELMPVTLNRSGTEPWFGLYHSFSDDGELLPEPFLDSIAVLDITVTVYLPGGQTRDVSLDALPAAIGDVVQAVLRAHPGQAVREVRLHGQVVDEEAFGQPLPSGAQIEVEVGPGISGGAETFWKEGPVLYSLHVLLRDPNTDAKVEALEEIGKLVETAHQRLGQAILFPPSDVRAQLVQVVQSEPDSHAKSRMLTALMRWAFHLPEIKDTVYAVLERSNEQPVAAQEILRTVIAEADIRSQIADDAELRRLLRVLWPLMPGSPGDTELLLTNRAFTLIGTLLRAPKHASMTATFLRSETQWVERLQRMSQDQDHFDRAILATEILALAGILSTEQAASQLDQLQRISLERSDPLSASRATDALLALGIVSLDEAAARNAQILARVPPESPQAALSPSEMDRLATQINQAPKPRELLEAVFRKGTQVVFINAHAGPEVFDETRLLGHVFQDAVWLAEHAGLRRLALPLPPSQEDPFKEFLQGAENPEFLELLDTAMGWYLIDRGRRGTFDQVMQRFRTVAKQLQERGVQFVLFGAEPHLPAEVAFQSQVERLFRAADEPGRPRMLVYGFLETNLFSRTPLRNARDGMTHRSHAAALAEQLGGRVVSVIEETRSNWEGAASEGLHNLDSYLENHPVVTGFGSHFAEQETALGPLRFNGEFSDTYAAAWDGLIFRIEGQEGGPDDEGPGQLPDSPVPVTRIAQEGEPSTFPVGEGPDVGTMSLASAVQGDPTGVASTTLWRELLRAQGLNPDQLMNLEEAVKRAADLTQLVYIDVHSSAFFGAPDVAMALTAIQQAVAESLKGGKLADGEHPPQSALRFVLLVDGATDAKDAKRIAEALAEAMPEASGQAARLNLTLFALTLPATIDQGRGHELFDLVSTLDGPTDQHGIVGSLIGPTEWVESFGHTVSTRQGHEVAAFGFDAKQQDSKTLVPGGQLVVQAVTQAVEIAATVKKEPRPPDVMPDRQRVIVLPSLPLVGDLQDQVREYRQSLETRMRSVRATETKA